MRRLLLIAILIAIALPSTLADHCSGSMPGDDGGCGSGSTHCCYKGCGCPTGPVCGCPDPATAANCACLAADTCGCSCGLSCGGGGPPPPPPIDLCCDTHLVPAGSWYPDPPVCDSTDPYECELDDAGVDLCRDGAGPYRGRSQLWEGGYPGGSVTESTTEDYCCVDAVDNGSLDGPITWDLTPTPCDDCSDCNANDECYSSGNITTDVDGDGDNDSCSEGQWYDCNSSAECPAFHSCVSNDCLLDEENCYDAVDNDGDGDIDADDADCSAWIVGLVTDESGMPLENAEMTAVGVDSGSGLTVSYSTLTDAIGNYNLSVSGNISYDVIAVLAGYATGFSWSNFINIGQTITIDFVLEGAINCDADCTLQGEDFCQPECQGVGGCSYLPGGSAADVVRAMAVCEDAQPGWNVPFNATHEIHCCDGLAYRREVKAIVGTEDTEHVATIQRIIAFGGRIVRLIVNVFK